MQSYLFTVEDVVNHFQAKSYEDLEKLTQEEVFDYFKDYLLAEKEAEEENDLKIILSGKNYARTADAFRARSQYMENVAEVEPYSRWLIYRDEKGAIKYSEKVRENDRSGLFKRHTDFTCKEYSPAQAIGEFAREAKRLEGYHTVWVPFGGRQ